MEHYSATKYTNNIFILIEKNLLVPMTGLEPVRSYEHQILSLGCLPIPPHRLVLLERLELSRHFRDNRVWAYRVFHSATAAGAPTRIRTVISWLRNRCTTLVLSELVAEAGFEPAYQVYETCKANHFLNSAMEHVTGIEPVPSAWKADILTVRRHVHIQLRIFILVKLVVIIWLISPCFDFILKQFIL